MAAGDTMEHAVRRIVQAGVTSCGGEFFEHGLKELKGYLLDEHMALIQQEPLLGYRDRVCFRAQREGYTFSHLHYSEVQMLVNRVPHLSLRDLRLRWVNELGEHLKETGF